MKRTDIPYSANEVTEMMDIGGSTLRKWCLALEQHNYSFIRTEQNKRMFTEKDLVALKKFQILVQQKNLPINTAAEVIATAYANDPETFSDKTDEEQYVLAPFANKTEQEQQPFMKETLEELRTDMEQLKSINKELIQRLEEQHKYIEDRLNKRDDLLMQSIRESQETKKLLLEQQEEQKKPRKGIFKFFSK